MKKYKQLDKWKLLNTEEAYDGYFSEFHRMLNTYFVPSQAACPHMMLYEFHRSFGIQREEMWIDPDKGLQLSDAAKVRMTHVINEQDLLRRHSWERRKKMDKDDNVTPSLEETLWKDMVAFFHSTDLHEVLHEVSLISRLGACVDEMAFPNLSMFYLHKVWGVERDEIEFDEEIACLIPSKRGRLKIGVGIGYQVELTLARLFDPEFWKADSACISTVRIASDYCASATADAGK